MFLPDVVADWCPQAVHLDPAGELVGARLSVRICDLIPLSQLDFEAVTFNYMKCIKLLVDRVFK
jgi:hypothetical protein